MAILKSSPMFYNVGHKLSSSYTVSHINNFIVLLIIRYATLRTSDEILNEFYIMLRVLFNFVICKFQDLYIKDREM